jgi:hypothetical protein
MKYQITSQEIKEADNKLDTKLLKFVSLYGVQVKEIDNFKERFGINALAVTDALNKIIYYSVNKKLDTISEEVSHIVVMLMGQENTLINDLINNIKDWSGYKSIYDEYMPIYNNEKQVKIEAIGKLIAECLIENWEHRIKKENNIIKDVANVIAINILNENQDFIDPNIYKIRRLNYEEAISGNKLAEDIINKFTNKDYNYKLTGSLAIAGQGETVYRYSKAPVNDLDFIVDNIEEYERINATMLSMNAVQIHDGLTNFQKKTKFYSYLVPGLGYTFKNLIRNDKNWLKEYTLINPKGEFVATIQHNTATESVYTKEDGSNLTEEEIDNLSQYNIPVDFYIYTVKSDEQPVGIFSSIQDMYFGKLIQSPNSINERMFQRKKDQWDYRFSNFINRNIEKKEFLYF